MANVTRRFVVSFALLVSCLGANAAAQDNPFGAPAAPAPLAGPDADSPKVADASDPILLAIQESKPVTASQLTRAARLLIRLSRYEDARTYLKQVIAGRPSPKELFELQQQFGVTFFLMMRREPGLAPEGEELGRAVLMGSYEAAREPQRLQQLTAQLSSKNPADRVAAVVDLRDTGTDGVNHLLSALANPQRAQEHQAIAGALPRLGEHGLPLMLAALSTKNDEFAAYMLRAIGRFGRVDTAAYLIPTAFDPQASEVRRQAATTGLASILGGPPSQTAAIRHLQRRVDGLLRGDRPIGAQSYDDVANVWIWSDESGMATLRRGSLTQARWRHAARLGKGLLRLAGQDPQVERLCWTALLGDAELGRREGRPWDEAGFAAASPDVVRRLLVEARDTDGSYALAGAARLAGVVGDPSWLRGDRGRSAPLVRLATHADAEVRFAALQSIMRLDDGAHYAGSSWVLDSIRRLAAVSDTPRVLVGDPRATAGQSLAAKFTQEGYVGDWAPSGRKLFEMATERGDYDLILIADIIDDPSYEQVLQWIRKDPRTRGVRVALLARSDSAINPYHRRREEARRTRERIDSRRSALQGTIGRRPTQLEEWDASQLTSQERDLLKRQRESREEALALGLEVPEKPAVRKRLRVGDDPIVDASGLQRGEYWADQDPLTWVFPRPHTPEAVAWVISDTLGEPEARGENANRLQRAKVALQWLEEIATSGRGRVYDLFRCKQAVLIAAQQGPLAMEAAPVLRRLGDSDCQRMLVDIATNGALPVKAREAAVEQLRLAFEQRSVLLGAAEMGELRARRDVMPAGDSSRRIVQQVLDVFDEAAASRSE